MAQIRNAAFTITIPHLFAFISTLSVESNLHILFPQVNQPDFQSYYSTFVHAVPGLGPIFNY